MGTGAAEQWNRGVFLILRTLMHFIGAAHYWYAIYYDLVYVRPPPDHPAYKRLGGFAGKFKYLTFLNAVKTKTVHFIVINSNSNFIFISFKYLYFFFIFIDNPSIVLHFVSSERFHWLK